MKTFILTLCVLSMTTIASAQSTLAKLKYEQAEEAYVKNDFLTTLIKLDEAQKILGSTNPKLLYLRIMAQKGIISARKFNYPELEAARKNVQFYLNTFERNEGIEEKYKEVYLFSES